MYPNTYLNLFPPFPRDNRVFVAMSFDPRFDSRWHNVLGPAVRRVRVAGRALEPHRVDLRKASDSVLTEILEGIARCRFFLADISVIGDLDGRPVRNANVLYEVGLAHAARMPDEVVLLRSDNRELLFDVMNVRVLQYDPDNDPKGAEDLIYGAIAQSLRELDLRQSMSVRRVAESLSAHCWSLLFEAAATGGLLRAASVITMRDALGAAHRRQATDRLLEIGVLQAQIQRVARDELDRRPFEEFVLYHLTEFGGAVVLYGTQELGLRSSEV